MASGEMCINTQTSSQNERVTATTDCKQTSQNERVTATADCKQTSTTASAANGDIKPNSRPRSPGKVLIRKNTPLMLPTIAKINAKDKFNTSDLVEGDEDAVLEEERRNKEKHANFIANQNKVISSVRVVVSCEGQSQENVEISNEAEAEQKET